MDAGGHGADKASGIIWREHSSTVLHVNDDRSIQIGDVSTKVALLPTTIVDRKGIKANIAAGANAVAQRKRFHFDGAHLGRGAGPSSTTGASGARLAPA